jgi:rare lipoprotein A
MPTGVRIGRKVVHHLQDLPMARLPMPRLRVASLAGLSLLLALAVHLGCSSVRQPAAAPQVIESGRASWYGPKFHGRRTANGERYDMHQLTAAHPTLPFGTLLEVRNLDNGRVCLVRVNDRGPFAKGRILDVSFAAAKELGMVGPGTARVELAMLPDAGSERTLVFASAAGGAGGGAWVGYAEGAEAEGEFTVQVGAFSEAGRAATLRDLLESRFPEAEVRSDGSWHRVQVGRFEERGAAEELRGELERLGWAALVVVIR